MGWSVPIDYSDRKEKKNHYALLKWRRQIGFTVEKKTVRSFACAVLVKECRSNSFPAHPRSVRGSGRRGCVPVNAEGFRGTRMEARRG